MDIDWAKFVAERNTTGCREVLRGDTSALASLIAAGLLCSNSFDLSEPVFTHDDDVMTFDEVSILVKDKEPDVDEDNLHRLYGLIVASVEDLFFHHPDHFVNLSGAIVYGDPYYFEDEDPTLAELVWAIFQVDAMLEESADELIGPSVTAKILDLTDENPVDVESLNEINPEFAGDIDAFYASLITARTVVLVNDLRKCGLSDDSIRSMDIEIHS